MKDKLYGVGSVKTGLPYKKPKTGYMKFKSYRLGRKAAKRGESVGSCPYILTDIMIDLLLKRDRWLRGHESVAWTKAGSKALHKRIDREKKEARENKRNKKK